MSDDTFHFRRFDVRQAGAAMKVGTDGLLLGLLADVPAVGEVLDVGTGTGLVALLFAQREASIRLTAIDIVAEAASQAAENFNRSPWADRMEALTADVCTYNPGTLFDFVVCNPPYYAHSPSTRAETRDIARLAVTLPLDKLAEAVVRLLRPEGRFDVVLPATVADDFRQLCWLRGLHLNKVVKVFSRPDRPHKREILSFSFHRSSVVVSSFAIYDAAGGYSAEYRCLVREYLVKI